MKDGVESFIFEGEILVTGYAKYLIEYLKGRQHNTFNANFREQHAEGNQDAINQAEQ